MDARALAALIEIGRREADDAARRLRLARDRQAETERMIEARRLSIAEEARHLDLAAAFVAWRRGAEHDLSRLRAEAARRAAEAAGAEAALTAAMLDVERFRTAADLASAARRAAADARAQAALDEATLRRVAAAPEAA